VEQKVKTSKSFCVLPWIHLATHPIGTVTPCCVTEMKNGASTAVKKGTDNIGLFLSKDSLEDINKFISTFGKSETICSMCPNKRDSDAIVIHQNKVKSKNKKL